MTLTKDELEQLETRVSHDIEPLKRTSSTRRSCKAVISSAIKRREKILHNTLKHKKNRLHICRQLNNSKGS